MRQRRTYHAGRTPKRGEVARRRSGWSWKVIEKYSAAATKRQVSVQVERDLKAENASLKKQLAATAKGGAPAPCAHGTEIYQARRAHRREGAPTGEAAQPADGRARTRQRNHQDGHQ